MCIVRDFVWFRLIGLQYLHKCSHEAINRKKTMLANIQVMTIYIYYIADDDIDNFLPHGVHSQYKSWTRDS